MHCIVQHVYVHLCCHDNFDNVVVVWLLRFKVDTGKFDGDIGMGNV